MTKPVFIETRDEKPSEDNPGGVYGGQRFEIASEARAKKLYPKAKILGPVDETPYVEPLAAVAEEEAKTPENGKS